MCHIGIIIFLGGRAAQTWFGSCLVAGSADVMGDALVYASHVDVRRRGREEQDQTRHWDHLPAYGSEEMRCCLIHMTYVTEGVGSRSIMHLSRQRSSIEVLRTDEGHWRSASFEASGLRCFANVFVRFLAVLRLYWTLI